MSDQKRILVFFLLLAVLPARSQVPAQTDVTIGEFRLRVAVVVFDETAQGFAPADMGPGSHVMLVELDLLSGDRDAFKDLKLLASHDQGEPTGAIIQVAGGMVKMLSTVSMTGRSSDYSPGKDNFVWAFVVPRDASGLFLEFADGETLDLSPYIK